MAELSPLKRKMLYKQVADELKEFIINNDMQSGDRLPSEHELAKMLGVSRTSIREGIRYLETLGFIETRIKTGITVKRENLQPITDYLVFNLKHSKVSWKELLEARKLLEIDAIELAVKNISEEEIGQMEGNMQECENRIRLHENIDANDYMFHQLIFKAAKNKVIEQFNVIIKEFFYNEDLTRQLVNNINDPDDRLTMAGHRRILDALKNKDVEQARKEMLNHLSDYDNMDLNY